MTVEAQQILKENEPLKTENKILALRVKALEKELYGRRSDKRPEEDPAQGKLEGVEEEASAWEAEQTKESQPARKTERKGKKKGPKPLNPDLPRVLETVPDPDLEKLICPVTGKMMKVAFTEKTEVLARKPAQWYVRVITRTVHASPTGDALSYSPWPADVLPKSRIDVSVIASILTGRFADHQPYHRQSGQFARQGIELAPNTLVSLVRQASEKLEPIYKAIVAETLKCNYLMMDPTPIRLMTNTEKGVDQGGVPVDLPGTGRTGVLRICRRQTWHYPGKDSRKLPRNPANRRSEQLRRRNDAPGYHTRELLVT